VDNAAVDVWLKGYETGFEELRTPDIPLWQMNPHCICISTAGVRANPLWLPELLARGYALHCGFDADEPGDAAASHMIALHPAVQRLRPPAHDWNDLLTSRR
jgi:hypothetical protein